MVGRVASVEAGRSFGSAGHALQYAAATIEVVEHIAGSLPDRDARELSLEIPLFAGPDALDTLRGEVLGTTRLLFLRNKGESARLAGLGMAAQLADAGYYRLVTFGPEVVDAGGTAIVPPDDRELLADLAGLPFPDAVAAARAAGQ